MISIFCDSASMITPDFAREHTVRVFPLSIEMDGQSKLDQIEITSDEVLDAIREKKMLHTSQPSIGDKLDAYNEVLSDPNAFILDLCMADGLSGTWQSARMAADQCSDPSRVAVINTRTLAGPLKAIVETAVRLRDENADVQKICQTVEKMMDTEHSLLAITDLDAVARSGRIPKAAAAAGGLLSLVPVVEKTKDGTSLKMNKVYRTMKKACRSMVDSMLDDGMNQADRHFYVCHAQNEEAACVAKRMIQEKLPDAVVDVLPLCSLFCVHGGPGCIAVQAVEELQSI